MVVGIETRVRTRVEGAWILAFARMAKSEPSLAASASVRLGISPSATANPLGDPCIPDRSPGHAFDSRNLSLPAGPGTDEGRRIGAACASAWVTARYRGTGQAFDRRGHLCCSVNRIFGWLGRGTSPRATIILPALVGSKFSSGVSNTGRWRVDPRHPSLWIPAKAGITMALRRPHKTNENGFQRTPGSVTGANGSGGIGFPFVLVVFSRGRGLIGIGDSRSYEVLLRGCVDNSQRFARMTKRSRAAASDDGRG